MRLRNTYKITYQNGIGFWPAAPIGAAKDDFFDIFIVRNFKGAFLGVGNVVLLIISQKFKQFVVNY